MISKFDKKKDKKIIAQYLLHKMFFTFPRPVKKKL